MEDLSDTTALLDAVEIEATVSVIEHVISPDENNNINANNRTNSSESTGSSGHGWKLISASVYSLVQFLIGGSVCVTLWFAFKSTPISTFDLHIGLSVIGYQLLAAHGLLTLQGYGWLPLPLKYRRRAHWVLQLTGAAFAIAGSAVIIQRESKHFGSWHGKLALAALIFTCASLINGLTSLYSAELRHLIPVKVSKISHIVFGASSFIFASAALCLGYSKKSFMKWASEEFAYVMIGVVAFYTFVLTVAPCLGMIKKLFPSMFSRC